MCIRDSVNGCRIGFDFGNIALFNLISQLIDGNNIISRAIPVSYTHLRAHETPEHLVCRLLLEKKKTQIQSEQQTKIILHP